MTSPGRSARASAPQNLGDETSGNEAGWSQARPADNSSSSTKSLQFRPVTKRKKSESPTPQPRMAQTRRRTVPRESQGAISSAKRGAVADDVKDDSADHNDLTSEQRHLIDENTAAIDRLADPQTPPNRPRVLTENGLRTIPPVFDSSPAGQGTSERTRDLPKEGLMFGDWRPGHGPGADDSPSLGSRHDHEDGSPSDRRIKKRARGSRREETELGDWLPGQGPQANDTSCLAPRHDHQEGASVGALNRRPRP